MANSKTKRGEAAGWIQIAIIAGVVVAALAITLALASGGENGNGPATEPRASGVPVEIARPDPIRHRVRVLTSGTVEPKARVAVVPEVGGRVVEVSENARAGAAFEAGEVLFRIDPRDYEVAVERAQAALADARSVLAELEAEAQISVNEYRALYPGREVPALAAREPQLEAARARVQSARADLAQARLNLERTRYTLPFDGRVISSRIEAGQQIAAGQSYGEAYDVGSLEIVAPTDPTAAARLDGALGRPAVIRLDDRDDPVSGVVAREGAALDARSRFVTLFIAPEADAAPALRPGQFADIVIEGPELSGVVALPARALAGLDTVHVVREGRIETETVAARDRDGDLVIVDRFDFGEGVIVSPLPEGAIGREASVVGERGEDESGDEEGAAESGAGGRSASPQ